MAMSTVVPIPTEVTDFLTELTEFVVEHIIAKLEACLRIECVAVITILALSGWFKWPRVYRIAKWIIYLDLAIFSVSVTMRFLTEFEFIECNWLEDLEYCACMADSDVDDSVAVLAATNPARDLPNDPVTLRAIKETSYIYDFLLDNFLPTSLPDDTDYELCSTFLRSLETREDLTFLVLGESSVRSVVDSIGGRRDSPVRPVAEEPFDLQARFDALSRHWSKIGQAPNKPQPWESTWDTEKLPPLLKAQPLVVNDMIGDNQEQDTFKLELTPEHEATATKRFNLYLLRRGWMVSYLKDHPPQPLGWAPVAKQPFALHSAWEDLFPDGNVEAGREVAEEKLVGNAAWRPMYKDSINNENVPATWVQPGREDALIAGWTESEYAEWGADSDERSKKRDERAAKVKAWQDEVRPAREAREREELERITKERAEANLALERDL